MTTATATTTETDAKPEGRTLLERVEGVRGVIEAHAAEADERRRLSDEVVEAMKDAGLFGIWLPEGVGGSESPLPEALRAFEALGRIDGSAGWIASIAASSATNYAAVSDDLFLETFGGEEIGIVATGAFPFQPAERVDGGYRISARWQYASGCHHATRLGGGAILMEDGKPIIGESGRPEVRILSFPREAAEILDTWDVTGLRGTGSADIVVTDLFVPEHETHQMLSTECNESCQGALYQLPLITRGAMPMASIALGIAQHAVDAFVELAATKVPALTETPLAARGSVQARFGAAAAALRAARSWHLEVAEDVWALTAWGDPVPLDRRLDAQLASAHATQTAVEVVEEMQALTGASAIYATNPIERCFRDIHTLKQNAGVSERNLEYVGGNLLGHPEANRLASL